VNASDADPFTKSLTPSKRTPLDHVESMKGRGGEEKKRGSLIKRGGGKEQTHTHVRKQFF
jgi:hypothetical protein